MESESLLINSDVKRLQNSYYIPRLSIRLVFLLTTVLVIVGCVASYYSFTTYNNGFSGDEKGYGKNGTNSFIFNGINPIPPYLDGTSHVFGKENWCKKSC